MTLNLDSHAIELTCPSCRGKFTQTLGQLKHKTNLACPRCRGDIALDPGKLRREVAKVEQSLAQLGKTASRLNK